MKAFIFSLLIVLPALAFAQREVDEDAPQKLKDRLYFGGGLGLNTGTDAYGNSFFYFAVNPIVGYMVTPKFSVGTGINWQRTSYDRPSVVLNQYGISPFVRYNFDQLFAYAEYNLISTPSYYNLNQTKTLSRFLIGLGYSQPLGKRGAVNAVGLYDVLYNQSERAFASPWVFRVFFSF